MENKKYYLYEKDEERWVEYDKESYEKMKRWRNNFCYRRRRNKACFCPPEEQLKMCNTICVTCPYRKMEKYFSQPVPGEKDITVGDQLSYEIDIEEQCVKNLDAEKILLRLDELMPKGREILRLHWEGYSWDEISKKVGISRRSIKRKLPEACEVLVQEFDELKNFSIIFKK